MSTNGLSNFNADTLALNLFTNLLDGESFNVPGVDLSDAVFGIPDTTNNPLYDAIPDLDVAALTTGVVDGTGLFDKLMKALGAQLLEQFNKGRITAETYAQAYIQLTQAALSNAVQFLLSSKGAQLQAILVQKQAQAAEVATVTERVRLEITKAQLVGQQASTKTLATEYALSKLKMATEDGQYALVTSQRARVDYENSFILPAELALKNKQLDLMVAEENMKVAQKDQVVYETTNILPKDVELKTSQKLDMDAGKDIKVYQLESILPAELADIQATTAGRTADKDKTVYETAYVLPAQVANVTEETAGKNFTNESILPAQLSLLNQDLLNKQAEKLGIEAETAAKAAAKDRTVYETASVLPAQVGQITAETALKAFELSDQLPAQIANVVADTAGKTYTNTWILPAQLGLLNQDLTNKQAEKLGIDADTSTKTAVKDKTIYETANILPAQKDQIVAETAIKNYQLTSQLPAQTANVTADTVSKDYTNQWILPAQLDSIREQTEGHRAKTLDTRSDGVTPVAGAIGKQKDLQQEQIISYRRDAESKVAKMLIDTWITQKSIDEGLAPPTSFADANLNTVISKLQLNLGLS